MSIFVKKSNSKKNHTSNNVFEQATSWADDIHASQMAKITLYQFIISGLLAVSVLLAIAISIMVPLQKTQLVVAHQSNDGVMWIDPPHTIQAMPTQAQTESELVNYVTNRESYSAFSYDYQYKLVNLMSNDDISKQYRENQTVSNPNSPIALLGQEGTKTAHIEDVVFIDNQELNNDRTRHVTSHTNLAQVNFTLTTKLKNTTTNVPYTALISWSYRGTPDDPQAKWQNWDGFTVTEYKIVQRSVDSNN